MGKGNLMKSKNARFLSGIIIILCGLSEPLFSQTWQTREFLDSLVGEAEAYRFRFFEEGLASVDRVKFNKQHDNHFRSFFNSLNLHHTMSDGAKRIKPWDELTFLDLGILGHESFHAYLENIARSDPDQDFIRQWFEMRASILYPDLPLRKAKVALEEAYATFAGHMITAYRSLDRMVDHTLSRMAYEPGLCERYSDFLARSWVRNWSDDVLGYYYREDVHEFWADQASFYWDIIRGKTPNDLPGAPIFTEQRLGRADKIWISQVFFEGRWSEDPYHSLPLIYEKLPCSQD